MSDTNIDVVRGDSVPMGFTFTNDDGSAHVLTGASVLLTVSTEAAPKDTNNQVAQITLVITDAAGGVATADFSALDTGQYYYDVQITNSLSQVLTPLFGEITVRQDITK
ncbi:MAG: hypothetical protein COB36_10670 [Alphaproteobacteria bacterium]|nr:MAG: hypothetical protein COB36_10670 [Alphaproteobacteria bacterium]